MKKNLFIGLITLVVMCLAGCNSNAPQLYMKSIYLTINKDEWKFDDKAKQFYAHFNLPEITADVFNYGNYSIHREYNTGTSDVYQVALPQSLYLSEQVQRPSENYMNRQEKKQKNTLQTLLLFL